MKTRDQIIHDIRAFVGDLGLPLEQHEIANGWSGECQIETLRILNGLHETLLHRLPIGQLNLGRGLDHWGVEGGPFFERACALSNKIRNLKD